MSKKKRGKKSRVKGGAAAGSTSSPFDPRALRENALAAIGSAAPWWIAAALLLLVFLFINRSLVTGAHTAIWDGFASFTPAQMLIHDFAVHGRVMWWNPYSNGGSPDFANIEYGALSPLNILMALAGGGGERGFRFYWLAIWAVSGLGILVLARHLGAPLWTGLAVAAGYMFSGFMLGQAEHTSWIQATAFLPFIIWRLDVAWRERRWWATVQAGALWGLSGLGGYPGLTALTGIYAALWLLARALLPDESGGPESPAWRRVSNACVHILLFSVIAFPIMAPPFAGILYDGTGFSERAGALDRDFALGNPLVPASLLSLSSPYLTWIKAHNRIWIETDLVFYSLYFGGFATVLGLAGAFLAKGRFRWFLLGGCVASLCFGMSHHLPFRGWLYDLLPVFRYFRHAGAFRVYFFFSLAVLALLAGRALVQSKEARDWNGAWRKFGIVGAATALVALVSFFITIDAVAVRRGPLYPWALLHLFAVWGAVLVLALTGWLAQATFVRCKLVPLAALAVCALDAEMTRSLSEWHSVFTTPDAPAFWRDVEKNSTSSLSLAEKGLTRERDSIGGAFYRLYDNSHWPRKQPVLFSYSPMINRFHDKSRTLRAYPSMALGSNRIWFAADPPKVRVVDGPFDLLSQSVEKDRKPRFVLHEPAAMLNPSKDAAEQAALPREISAITDAPPALPASVKLERYAADEMIVTVEAPSDGWVMITDRWARGWRAAVNGAPRQIYGANFLFRALPVAAGSNRIEMSYHPFAEPGLLAASWSLLAVVALGSIVQTARGSSS